MLRDSSFFTVRIAFALGLCVAVGCSESVSVTPGTTTSTASGGSTTGSSTSSGTGGSSSSTGSGGTDPATTTLTATMGPYSIPAGQEAVKCIVVNLGNPAPAFVRRFRTSLEPGSHHMIVYLTDEPETQTPFDCQSFGAGGSAIFIAQQAHSELVFPTDPNGVPVGLELAANQKLRLEMHYINATSAELDVVGKAEMDVLSDTATIIKSGFAFEGNLSIPTIPALGEADTGLRFQPGIPGTRVFALTTHQHHLGTEMKVWYADDANDTSKLVADSLSWSDPPLVLFTPPLEFPSGSTKGFTYQCHWKNPTASPVGGGLGANDEMCFFWHYYYPVAP